MVNLKKMSKKRNGVKKGYGKKRKSHSKASKRQNVGYSSKITDANATSSQAESAAATSSTLANQIKTW